MSKTNVANRNFEHVPPENGFGALAKARPEVYQSFFGLADAIMRSDGVLSFAERELVGSYVSKISDCTFCYDSHVACAAAVGEPDAVDKINSPTDSMKALYDLAQKVVAHERPINRSDIDAVIDAGWPEAAADEVIHISAMFGFANRVVTGFGFVGTQESYDRAAKFMAKSYKP